VSFLEIFQPGLKHLREERDRQRMLVVRPSNGAGPPLGIDLDAGKAIISLTPPQLEPREPEAHETGPA
jgi:Family of unknown function (DUF6191)